MPVTSSHIINVISELSEVQEIKVTVTESLKGSVITGCCAFAGGLLGGPVGLGVGGVVGACMSAYNSQGKFKPLVSVLREMSEDQKERLAQSVQRAIENVHTEDILIVLSMVMSSGSLQALVINEVKSFLGREMNMRLM